MTRKQHPSYRSYIHLRERCNNPNNKDYARYGGRGIKCLWNSFIEFITDMGMRPTSSHSIDRIDNNGNYEASNCRWATVAQQASNKSRNGPVPGTRPRGFPVNNDPMRFIQFTKGSYQLRLTMLRCGPEVHIGRYPTLEEAQAVRDICEYERNVYVNLGMINNSP